MRLFIEDTASPWIHSPIFPPVPNGAEPQQGAWPRRIKPEEGAWRKRVEPEEGAWKGRDERTDRKLSCPPLTSSSYYYKSPPADKMSDYEDIWEKTPDRENRPGSRFQKSLTPTESEQHFKDYLIRKLSEGPPGPDDLPDESDRLCQRSYADPDHRRRQSSCDLDRRRRQLSSCVSSSSVSPRDSTTSVAYSSEGDLSSTTASSDDGNDSDDDDGGGGGDGIGRGDFDDEEDDYGGDEDNENDDDDVTRRLESAPSTHQPTMRPSLSCTVVQYSDSDYSDPYDLSEKGKAAGSYYEDDLRLSDFSDIPGESCAENLERAVAAAAAAKSSPRPSICSSQENNEGAQSRSETEQQSTPTRHRYSESSFPTPGSVLRPSLHKQMSASLTNIPLVQEVKVEVVGPNLLNRSSSARLAQGPRRKDSKTERRLSSVLGKYMKPPSKGRKVEKEVWQVDSSSWEFLGQDLESARPAEKEPSREPSGEQEASDRLDKGSAKASPEAPSREAGGTRVLVDSGGESSLANRAANEEEELADVRTGSLLTVLGGPQTEERKNYEGFVGRCGGDDSVYETGYDSSLASHRNDNTLSWDRGGRGGPVAQMEDAISEDRVPRPSAACQAPAGVHSTVSARIIQDHVVLLSQPESGSLFGRVTAEFIRCARESAVRDPRILMRNMRQFMNGLKNYLVRTGEGELQQLIQLQRSRLRPTELLNVDTILEEVIQTLVTKPLRLHLVRLLAADPQLAAQTQLMAAGLRAAAHRPPADFALPPAFAGGRNLEAAVEFARLCWASMTETDSPAEKLAHILRVVTHIQDKARRGVGVEELVRSLSYLLSQSNIDTLHLHLQYIQGLLPASMLCGEAGYFLAVYSTTLYTVSHFPAILDRTIGPSIQVVVGVQVADDRTNSLTSRLLPLHPGMTVRDLTRRLTYCLKLPSEACFSLYAVSASQDRPLDAGESVMEVVSPSQPVSLVFRGQGSNLILPFA